MTKKKNPKVRLIRLRNGYVESNTCSVLEFYNDVGLPTRYDALKHLATVLFAYYRVRVLEDEPYGCCEPDFEAGKKHCSNCGSKLKHTDWPADFFNFICSLIGRDSNSTGELHFEYLYPNGWDFHGEPFGIKEEEALVIPAYGAEALFLAAYEGIGDKVHKQQFIKHVTGEDHNLPYWWWEDHEDRCDKDIKRFAEMVNNQDIN